MPDVNAQDHPTPAEMVLLAEAADQGPEGLAMVRDTLYNRSKSRKLPMDQVAMQSKLNQKGVRVFQYTGAGREDLRKFYDQQPPMLQNLAHALIQETQHPDFQPKYPGLENYVTQHLYDRRFSPDVSEWVRTYQPVGRVGNHVLLMPPAKPKAHATTPPRRPAPR